MGVSMKRKKKVWKIIGITLGALAVLMAVAAVLFSMNVGKQVAEGILYMNAGNDTKQNSVKHLEKKGYNLEEFEEKYGNLATAVKVKAEDGIEIPAEVYLCGNDSPGTVILSHGLGGDRVTNYPVAEIFLKNNWNVISYDQRGSGDSPDNKISFGYFEKQDVKALVDYAKDVMKSSRIVVHGQSMGAATAALYASSEHAIQNVDAVILDSCFDSMESMFLGVWRQMDTEGIPESYILACGDWYLKQHYGFGFADTDIAEKLKEVKTPVLMLHMNKDEIISTQKANEMFENIIAQKKQICYFDSVHIDGVIDDPEQYEENIFSFLGD